MNNRLTALFTLLLLCLVPATVHAAAIDQTGQFAGQQRSWRLFVPAGTDKSTPLPLLFNFHGTGSDPADISALNEFEQLAAKEGFIVVAPRAEFSYESDGPRTWNVEKKKSPYNDVAFIRALITHLSATLPIDASRIYATGFSGGARMTSRLGCDLTSTFAAIAPIGGIRFADDCLPTATLPVLTYHGIKDPVNHYQHQPHSPRYWHMGVQQALNGWVSHNQCHQQNEEEVSPGIARMTYSQCDNHTQVIFYRSQDAGHTWPGSPRAAQMAGFGLGKTDPLPMTEIIWQFLNQYRR
ncbi:alpha/beta hydrolase family esterase [Alteromonas gilva]|uniref:PHB depolymerase family esterase n=1 Tax=Alteromonas gilva TaxID=2987522 RepID=A0ABT5L0J7_9ALTE|nr:PHB depolymerase family esterase [Alteromonas gilva]MDC8830553.1 PHB depolymerase family esterase [Alteromonas gilva]